VKSEGGETLETPARQAHGHAEKSSRSHPVQRQVLGFRRGAAEKPGLLSEGRACDRQRERGRSRASEGSGLLAVPNLAPHLPLLASNLATTLTRFLDAHQTCAPVLIGGSFKLVRDSFVGGGQRIAVRQVSIKEVRTTGQGHRLFQTGKHGCHGPGVIDKAVLLSIRTAIPKTGSPWHPSLKKAMALDVPRFVERDRPRETRRSLRTRYNRSHDT